jgi:hypothetical protein
MPSQDDQIEIRIHKERKKGRLFCKFLDYAPQKNHHHIRLKYRSYTIENDHKS